MTKPYGGRIEGWSYHWLFQKSIMGNLFNDPRERWAGGSDLITSTVVKLDEKNGKLETENTLYDLGEKYARHTPA